MLSLNILQTGSGSIRTALLAGLATLALSGCGPSGLQADYGKLELADVTGQVTLDGEPLSDAAIIFADEGGNTGSYGRTDGQGHYHMRYDSEQTGVKPGDKTVRISTSQTLGEEETVGLERIPARYNKESELNRTVEPGSAQTFDFALESSGEIVQPLVETGGPDG